MTIDYLLEDVYRWGITRQFHTGSTAKDQLIKLVEEVGELSKAITRQGEEEQMKELGDCLVVLQMICLILDLDMEDCLKIAYESIEYRKGRMVDGIFIKEGD